MCGLSKLFFFLCLSAHTLVHAEVGSSEIRGALLYSTHCKACHAKEVHWREQTLATNWDSLKIQVRRWQAIIGQGWSEEEIADVADYLNTLHYGFPVSSQKNLLQGKKTTKRNHQSGLSYHKEKFMQLPLQITIRDVDPSEALETHIREKAKKLDEFFDHIMSCRVVVEVPHKHHYQGKQFNVRIDIGVPGSEIVVNKDHAEDVYVALRDAFDAAKRQLEEYARILHGNVKTHQHRHQSASDDLDFKP